MEIKHKGATKVFAGFYIVFSTIIVAFAFNNFSILNEEKKQLLKMEEMMEKRRDLGFIAHLDKGQGISESQFILAVLEHLGTISREKDIKPWKAVS